MHRSRVCFRPEGAILTADSKLPGRNTLQSMNGTVVPRQSQRWSDGLDSLISSVLESLMRHEAPSLRSLEIAGEQDPSGAARALLQAASLEELAASRASWVPALMVSARVPDWAHPGSTNSRRPTPSKLASISIPPACRRWPWFSAPVSGWVGCW